MSYESGLCLFACISIMKLCFKITMNGIVRGRLSTAGQNGDYVTYVDKKPRPATRALQLDNYFPNIL
jgi:hypothetical protein